MKNRLTIFIHIAVWTVVFSFQLFVNPPDPPPFAVHHGNFLKILVTLFCVLIAISFYINMYLLIPRVLYRKQWPLFMASLIGIYLILVLTINFLLKALNPIQVIQKEPFLIFFSFLYFFSIAISTSIRLSVDKIKLDNQLKDKENENLKSELSLLRSQVSPHFMFNVLNSLAALARKKSDQMEFVIIQLSTLMRYMVYDVEDEKITIEKELEYLNSYINLQKLRFGNDVLVTFSTSVEKGNIPIEPMLLIPFVENAFKHGIGMIIQPIIDINFTTSNSLIHFVVRNKVSQANFDSKDSNSGIGLTNLTRRLNLLYKNRHYIKTQKTQDNWYVAELKISIQ